MTPAIRIPWAYGHSTCDSNDFGEITGMWYEDDRFFDWPIQKYVIGWVPI